MASWDQYYRVISDALAQDAFGELDPMESAVLRLRSGVNEPRRDLEEVALKLGVTREWVGLVEQALVERLRDSNWWPRLEASQPQPV
jgi:DNA-directed RNA polymerase sigma subunit (sigma70/sigma32)